MPWGDSPTDSFMAVTCCFELGIFDEPISDKEWEHALTATATDFLHVDNDQDPPSPRATPTASPRLHVV